MMDSHLTERALEALAHDRMDLVAAPELEHFEQCAACQEQVAELMRMSEDLSLAMRSEAPLDFDLDAIVTAAMASAFADDSAEGVLEAQAAPVAHVAGPQLSQPFTGPTRGSWALAAFLGLLVSAAAGLGSQPSFTMPSISSAVDLLKVARTIFAALDGALVSRLPGGWGFVMVSALCLFAMLALPLARLVTGRVRVGAGLPMATLGALVLGLCVSTSSAQALEFEGEFSDKELVSIDVMQKPASEALRRVAASAGLGFVATLPADPVVSVRVNQAPLRDVITAVLGDAPLLVKREGKLIVVRPLPTVRNAEPSGEAPGSEPGNAAQAPAAPAAPATPAPPAPPAPPAVGVPVPAIPGAPTLPTPPSPPGTRRKVADRVTFGGSTVVHKGERVKDVVTMGGHSVVYGIVEGDVVVMGGSVEIKKGAEVFGEIVAIGGHINTEPGAIIHNGGEAPPGDANADGAQAGGPGAPHKGDGDGDGDEDGDGDDEEDDEGDDDDDDRVAHTGPSGHHGGPAIRIIHEDDEDEDRDQEEGWLSGTLSSLSRHALLFVLGLVLFGAFPRRIRAVTETILESPLRAGATGVLSALAAVVLCLLLVITIIGIPAGIVLALGSALAAYAGLAATAWVVGSVLPWRVLHVHPMRELAAGVFLLFVSSRVPVVGPIVLAVACAIGLGAIVRTRFAEPPLTPPGSPDIIPPAPPPMGPLPGEPGAADPGIV